MSLTKSPRGNAGVLLLLLLLLAVLVACGKTVPAPQLPSPPTPQPTAVLPSPSPPSISQALSPSEARRRINEAYGRAVRLTRIGETASAERALGLVRQIYVAAFQEVAIRIDGETYLFMARAMVEAQNAVPAKNAEVVSLSQQWTDMGLYKIAFEQVRIALDRGDARNAVPWFQVLEEGVGFKGSPANASALMTELQSTPQEMSRLKPQLLAALRRSFTEQAQERVAEAVELLAKGSRPEAALKAVEAFGYYRLVQSDARQALGGFLEPVLARELQLLVDGTNPKATTPFTGDGAKAQALLKIYAAAAAGSGLEQVVGQLVEMFRLLDRAYEVAVSQGQVVNQAEYEDARLLLRWGTEVYEGSQRQLLGANPLVAADLAVALDRLAAAVEGRTSLAEVSALIESQVRALRSLLGEKSATTGRGQ